MYGQTLACCSGFSDFFGCDLRTVTWIHKFDLSLPETGAAPLWSEAVHSAGQSTGPRWSSACLWSAWYSAASASKAGCHGNMWMSWEGCGSQHPFAVSTKMQNEQDINKSFCLRWWTKDLQTTDFIICKIIEHFRMTSCCPPTWLLLHV